MEVQHKLFFSFFLNLLTEFMCCTHHESKLICLHKKCSWSIFGYPLSNLTSSHSVKCKLSWQFQAWLTLITYWSPDRTQTKGDLELFIAFVFTRLTFLLMPRSFRKVVMRMCDHESFDAWIKKIGRWQLIWFVWLIHYLTKWLIDWCYLKSVNVAGRAEEGVFITK